MVTDRSHTTDHDPAWVVEQRAETGRAGTVGPSLPTIPEPMTRGLGRGALVGALVGAAVLTPLAFLPIGDLSFVVKLVLVVLVGVVAGSVVGGVFFASAVAEVEDDDSDGDDELVPDQMRRGS